MIFYSSLETALLCLLALLLDRVLAEPRRFHPLIGFGHLANVLERRLNRVTNPLLSILSGTIAAVLALSFVLALLVPWYLGPTFQQTDSMLRLIPDLLLLYLAVGHKSLEQHVLAIASPLEQGKLDEARQAVGMIVSRDSEQMDQQAVIKAASESMLENGNDAVFAALFWFFLFAGPGVVIYRLANTLDAMWGYRSKRFLYFGRTAARLDDVLNWIPARLTVICYALGGQVVNALQCAWRQGRVWESPNAGPVMASGAAALGIELGGAAQYAGKVHQRPLLGRGRRVEVKDIRRTVNLVRRALLIWCVVMVMIGVAGA